jgi:hypothetical protein
LRMTRIPPRGLSYRFGALSAMTIAFISLLLIDTFPIVTTPQPAKGGTHASSRSVSITSRSRAHHTAAPHISAMVAACSASDSVWSCFRSGEASALWKVACLIGDLAFGDGGPSCSSDSPAGTVGAGTGESGGDSHSDSAAEPAASLTSSASHAAPTADDAVSTADVSADSAPAASSLCLCLSVSVSLSSFLLQRFAAAFCFFGRDLSERGGARFVPSPPCGSMGAPP